jgi:predicted nucleic acid-binding Zn ribbon protein
MSKGMRPCVGCGTPLPVELTNCPRCGAVRKTAWRRQLIGLAFMFAFVAVLLWLIVRYAYPVNG